MDIFRTKTKKGKSSLSSSYLQRRTYGIAAMILGSAGRPYNRFAPSLSTQRKRKNSLVIYLFFRNKTKINILTFFPPALGSTPSFWLWARTASRCSRRNRQADEPAAAPEALAKPAAAEEG